MSDGGTRTTNVSRLFRIGVDTVVRDAMARDVITVSASDTCHRALSLMHAAGVGRLPVLDRQRLVGIITEGDIHRRVPAGLSPASVSVAGIMTYAPVSVAPTLPLPDAARLLLDRKIVGVPVVDHGGVIGMLTRRDALATLLGPRKSGVRPHGV